MIIGVVGLIGAGKDTVARYIVEQYNFERDSFAAPLKECLSIVFGWDRLMLEGLTPEHRRQRETIDKWWAEKLNIPELSPRWVMQHWGTDVMRKHFHNDIWATSMEHRLLRHGGDVVISDCRFPNEIQSIKKAGGIVIQVSKEEPEWFKYAVIHNKGPEKNTLWCHATEQLKKYNVHESEFSWAGIEFDYYIENTGTLDELYVKTTDLMQKLGYKMPKSDQNLFICPVF